MDDEFNMLGAVQRRQNLKQNEATRREIAALRADLKAKEAAERAAPKCPYCAGVITGGVVKCRHCTSDIKWCEVRGKNYPIKIDEDPTAFAASQESRLRAAAKLKAAEQKRDAERFAQKRLQVAKSNRSKRIVLIVLMAIMALLLLAVFVGPLFLFLMRGW